MTRATGPTTDEMLYALANGTRRRLLSHLREQSVDEVPTTALVGVLGNDMPAVQVDGGHREVTQTALHHNHLPRLDDAGLIEYQRDAHLVSYRPDETVEAILELLEIRQ